MTATRRDAEVAAMAASLIAAERDRREIPQFSDQNPDLDLPSAYLAQQAFVQSKIEAGDRLVGYKLGLDQQKQAACHGRGCTALRPGDRQHDLHLR